MPILSFSACKKLCMSACMVPLRFLKFVFSQLRRSRPANRFHRLSFNYKQNPLKSQRNSPSASKKTGANRPCHNFYPAASSIFSIKIPYPVSGWFTSTWVTAHQLPILNDGTSRHECVNIGPTNLTNLGSLQITNDALRILPSIKPKSRRSNPTGLFLHLRMIVELAQRP